MLKLFDEIEFAVVAEPSDYTVEYKIYEIVGRSVRDDKVLFHKADSDCHPDPVEELAEAEVYLSGHVKWDGCSNWNFDGHDMRHFCGRSSLENVGKILAACYDMTAELCPNWLKD